MEVATATASSFSVNPGKSSSITSARSVNPNLSSRACLGPSFLSSFPATGSLSSGFSSLKLRPESVNPASISRSKTKRSVVTNVIPFSRGSAWEQPPPDLASYIFKNRIVYLGMCLFPAVTELIMAEFMYLEYDDPGKPMYLYINSTGTMKNGEKLGYEHEALALYDSMRMCKSPIFTLCVGNAWGEAAFLLAAGAPGNRSALPSTSIMLRQPMARLQGQATDVDIHRREVKSLKEVLVKLLAKNTGQPPEKIEADIRRPKYFTPEDAVEYGLIDKVLHTEKASEGDDVVSKLKKANLIDNPGT